MFDSEVVSKYSCFFPNSIKSQLISRKLHFQKFLQNWENQVKMVFLYDHKLIESKGKVSLKTDNQKLEKVLKEWIILLRPDR